MERKTSSTKIQQRAIKSDIEANPGSTKRDFKDVSYRQRYETCLDLYQCADCVPVFSNHAHLCLYLLASSATSSSSAAYTWQFAMCANARPKPWTVRLQIRFECNLKEIIHFVQRGRINELLVDSVCGRVKNVTGC
jgi:hypothetical protein